MKKNIFQNLINSYKHNLNLVLIYIIAILCLVILYQIITIEINQNNLEYKKNQNYFPEVEIVTK